jgi:hypothetical protein
VTSTRRASASDGRRRGAGRQLVAALLAVALGIPASALAHDGVGASYRGQLGRYLVYVYDGFPGERGLVDYRVVVLEAATQEPVYDVAATVRDASDDAKPPAPVPSYGNVFYFSLPNVFPDRERVRLALSGPLGEAVTTFRVHGIAPQAGAEIDGGTAGGSDGAGRWWAIAAAAVGGVLVAGWLARRLRRGG